MTHLKLAYEYRKKSINIKDKKLLLTTFSGSDQEKDLSQPPNCNGLGRIRHFYYNQEDWNVNPLPIIPVSNALGLDEKDSLRAQVFQNAVCNYRCWYCYVDFKLLSANPKFSKFVTVDEIITSYIAQESPPPVIVLSGGQPDIVPEWTVWVIEELLKKGLQKVYLWGDDNLSNFFYWEFLDKEQRNLIENFNLYSKVCCFKGYDESSFTYNTGCIPEEFERQIKVATKYVNETSLDLYFYITLTNNEPEKLEIQIKKFLDRLQEVSYLLPLRIVPLKVASFNSNKKRLKDLDNQFEALKVWQSELNIRFTQDELGRAINLVNIR